MQSVAVFLALVAVASAGGLNGYTASNYVQHAHVAQPVAVAQPALAVRAAPVAYAQPALATYGAGPIAYGQPALATYGAVRAGPVAYAQPALATYGAAPLGVATYGGAYGLGARTIY